MTVQFIAFSADETRAKLNGKYCPIWRRNESFESNGYMYLKAENKAKING